MRPGAAQEQRNRARHAGLPRALDELVADLISQPLALRHVAEGARLALALALVAALRVAQGIVQAFQREGEGLGALDLAVAHHAHRVAHRTQVDLEGRVFLVRPGQAVLRDAVKQRTRGVLLVGEKARVGHRQAQQRRAQLRDGRAHRRQQPVV